MLRTWFNSRTRWEKAALFAWSSILVFVSVRVFISPESKTVFPIFSASGRFWWAGADLYEPHRSTAVQEGFRYSPTFAILVTPFAWLPDDVGGVAWRLFNVAALFGSLAWLLQALLQPKQPRNVLAWLMLLTMPLTLQSVNNGQSNLVVVACMVGTVAAVKEKRWNLASGLMALAFICKLYPVALGMLLIVLYPRQLLCRLPLTALASMGLPFFCQSPAYVIRQYEDWFALLGAEDRSAIALENMYRDLWLLIYLYGLPIGRNVYMLVQVWAGVGIALLCWHRQREGWPERTLLSSALGLGTAWMMLLGPATESSSFALLAPSLAWSVVEALQSSEGSVRRVLLWACCVLFGSAVLLGGFSATVKIHLFGVHAWGSLLYFVYLLTESRPRPRTTEARQELESQRMAA
jgi:hypothetical protein